MSPLNRFALQTCGAFEALASALVDVAAFVFTLGYIDHITTRGQCRCRRCR
jgi:hypothetical protein